MSESTLSVYNKTARVLKIEEIVSDEEKERQAYAKISSIPSEFFSFNFGSLFINAPMMYGFSLIDVDYMWLSQNRTIGLGLVVLFIRHGT